MVRDLRRAAVAATLTAGSLLAIGAEAASRPTCSGVEVKMTPGPAECFPNIVDGNIPMFWLEKGKERRLVVFTFVDDDCCDGNCYRQVRVSGRDLAEVETAPAQPVQLPMRRGAWCGLQAVHPEPKTDPGDDEVTLYGWYHEELYATCEPASRTDLSAPRIGAAKSIDGGYTWTDLGIVLDAPRETDVADTANMFFCGGYGDFSVVLDEASDFFYFFFGSYRRLRDEPGGPIRQGLSVARMAREHLGAPCGRVEIWNGESWERHDPRGRPYHKIAPIFPAKGDWHAPCGQPCGAPPCNLDKAEELGAPPGCPDEGSCTDAMWGPAVHWNAAIGRWVMLMNRACSPCWGTRGHYVSFNDDLSDPAGWCEPMMVDDYNTLYSQVLGLGELETDRRIGGSARYITGHRTCGIIEFRPVTPSSASPPAADVPEKSSATDETPGSHERR